MTLPSLQPGDIVGVRGGSLLFRLIRSIFRPESDRFHFFLIKAYCPELDDFELIESNADGLFAKGITHGWLRKQYTGADLEIYRPTCPDWHRKYAPLFLTAYGSARYDFWLFVKMLLVMPVRFFSILLTERHLRHFRATDFPDFSDSAFVCTEAVDHAYRLTGYDLLPGALPTPSAFKEAEYNGTLRLIWKGIL